MDFQLSSGRKQKCPKCNNTSMTFIRVKGILKLQCSCGWYRVIQNINNSAIPNKNISGNNILKR